MEAEERAKLLKTTICGLEFASPVLVAAGPPGRDARGMIECARNGAGGIVAKTISVRAASVPRPCMARASPALRDSMLNVELWSDMPPDAWVREGGEYAKVRAAKECSRVPLIASVGYTASDVSALVPQMDARVDAYEFSCHYTSVADVRGLASAIRERTRKPVFAKLSPHGHDLVALARELKGCGVDGFVVMNSLGPCLAVDVAREMPLLGGAGGKGWLSGAAIKPIALHWVAQLAREFPGTPVIGVGGVATWRDAVEYLLCGASAVQVCTAAIYRGPRVFAEIGAGIAEHVKARGFANVQQLRGRALRNLPCDANLVAGVSSVDEARCNHCGQCATSCVYSAIDVDTKQKTWKINPQACYGCGLCVTVCPRNALSLATRK